MSWFGIPNLGDIWVEEVLDPGRHYTGWLYCELSMDGSRRDLRLRQRDRKTNAPRDK